MALVAVLLFGQLAGTCYAGAGVPVDIRDILENADYFELLSIDPTYGSRRDDSFHGRNVLGRIVVRDRSNLAKLVAAFRKGVEENPGYLAACFNPRHGIRASRAGKSVDLVICFECAQVQAISGGRERWFLTTGSPEPVFDAMLRSANVPLARDLKPAPDVQAPVAPLAPAEAEALFVTAQALEQENVREAIRTYRRAARNGNGKAAMRLGQIYREGLLSVPKDWSESEMWFEKARSLGEQTP